MGIERKFTQHDRLSSRNPKFNMEVFEKLSAISIIPRLKLSD